MLRERRELGWWMALACVGAAVFGLQMWTVLNPAMVEFNPEESINAAQALVGAEGLWRYFLRLQYVDFCGGCTVDAALGAGVFSVLPPTWLAWKVVPALWATGFTVLGAAALGRAAGRPAALAFLVLMLGPLDAWQRLAVYGLGNHVECGILSALVLVTLGPAPGWRRAAAAGLVAGVAVWVGYSATFVTGVGALWLMWARRWRPLLAWSAGVGVGLTALLHRAAFLRRHPSRTLYQPTDFRPDLSRVVGKLEGLADPALLLSLSGSGSEGAWWWSALSGLGMAGAGVWGVWRGPPLARLLALGVLGWLVAYAVVGFALEPLHWGQRPTPLGLRYAAPALALLMVLVSVVVGALWARGRRVWAVAALMLPLGPGLATRFAAVSGARPLSELAGLHAVDQGLWRDVLSERLSSAELAEVVQGGSESAAVAAWSLGRRAARDGPLRPPADHEVAWAGGLGAGHHDRGSPRPGPAVSYAAALEGDLAAAGIEAQGVVVAFRSFWGHWLRSFGDPGEVGLDGPAGAGLSWARGAAVGHAIGGCWGPVGADLVAVVAAERARRESTLPPAWLEGVGFGVGTICGPDPAVKDALETQFQGASSVETGFDAGVRGRWGATPSRGGAG